MNSGKNEFCEFLNMSLIKFTQSKAPRDSEVL